MSQEYMFVSQEHIIMESYSVESYNKLENKNGSMAKGKTNLMLSNFVVSHSGMGMQMYSFFLSNTLFQSICTNLEYLIQNFSCVGES